MDFDVLRDLQARGHFFWQLFPGAQASDKWQRQQQIERSQKAGSHRPSAFAPAGPAPATETSHPRMKEHRG